MSKYEAIEVILKQYRETLADYEIALNDFCKIEAQLILHEKAGIEEASEVIEGLSISASVIKDMPRSITNKFSSVVENAVIDYHRYLRPSKFEIDALKDMIHEKAQLLLNYDGQIKLVDNMLKCLTDTEKFIVEYVYIRGYNYRQTKEMFNQTYPSCYIYDKDTVKLHKYKALEKMKKRLK